MPFLNVKNTHGKQCWGHTQNCQILTLRVTFLCLPTHRQHISISVFSTATLSYLRSQSFTMQMVIFYKVFMEFSNVQCTVTYSSQSNHIFRNAVNKCCGFTQCCLHFLTELICIFTYLLHKQLNTHIFPLLRLKF